MRWAGCLACTGHKIFVRKPEGKRIREIIRRTGEGNIRMGLRESGREVVDWIYLTQDRV